MADNTSELVVEIDMNGASAFINSVNSSLPSMEAADAKIAWAAVAGNRRADRNDGEGRGGFQHLVMGAVVANAWAARRNPSRGMRYDR